MTSIIAVIQWVIANWSIIATCFSSAMSILLFFMHGGNKKAVQEVRDLIASIQVSQTQTVDTSSAQAEARQSDPKK